MRRAAFLLVAAAASGCTATQLSRPAAITRAQAKALPPKALTRRIFGTLASSLLAYPVPDPNPRLVFRGLTQLNFITPAAYDGEPGLCEAEHVAVHFSPPADPTYLDPPVRPAGMRSTRVLILRDPAATGRARIPNEADYAREQAACAALDPRQHRLISGSYAYEAALLLRWTADLTDGARAGREPDVPLDCEAFRGDDGRSLCLRELASFRVEQVIVVSRCTGPAFPRALCYTVSNGAYELNWEIAGDESSRPVRVTFQQIITT